MPHTIRSLPIAVRGELRFGVWSSSAGAPRQRLVLCHLAAADCFGVSYISHRSGRERGGVAFGHPSISKGSIASHRGPLLHFMPGLDDYGMSERREE